MLGGLVVFVIISIVLFIRGKIALDESKSYYNKAKNESNSAKGIRNEVNLKLSQTKSLENDARIFYSKGKSVRNEAKSINNERQLLDARIEKKTEALNKMVKEKTIGFPWLAKAYSEAETIIDSERAKFLNEKKHPAYKAAEVVKEIKKEKRELLKQKKKYEYIIEYYETIFPQLLFFKDKDIEDKFIRISGDSTNEDDEVKDWLSEGEYKELSIAERNQLALDRYKERFKSKLEIGLAYERFIGYLYEQGGYAVEYHGIKKGLKDLGIDLICEKDDNVKLIQCKYWSRHKEIHENAVNQLFGTTLKYCYENFDNFDFQKYKNMLISGRIEPIIITSTRLSEQAKDFARVLNVSILDNQNVQDYPMIKCNWNRSDEKIYHLPFDQQYDNLKMNNTSRTCYVYSVKEAEQKGYRRAYRWNGNNDYGQGDRHLSDS